MTDSMSRAVEKPVAPLIEMPLIETKNKEVKPAAIKKLSKVERRRVIEKLIEEMKAASKALQFERAAELRDLIIEIEGHF